MANQLTGKEITHLQIRALHAEARDAGDEAMVDMCLMVLAYRGGENESDEVDAARERIAEALNAARAMED